MSKTATQSHFEEVQRSALNQHLTRFIERWQPDDPQQAAQFNAELNMLVREVYLDMQAPVTRCLEAVLAAAPMQPIFKSPQNI